MVLMEGIMQKKELSIATIETWLRDGDCDVRRAALEACKGRDVPLEIIETGLRDGDWAVRSAALEACKGRDVPLEIIETWLRDGDWAVRRAALEACKGRDVNLPAFRSFEPPATVYKKCKFGVIVAAQIPPDAQVRGSSGSKCRANRAIITQIFGDVCGEPVGISLHDGRTTYYVGDEVVIDDFDPSDAECSAGFHFFCTRKQAEAY